MGKWIFSGADGPWFFFLCLLISFPILLKSISKTRSALAWVWHCHLNHITIFSKIGHHFSFCNLIKISKKISNFDLFIFDEFQVHSNLFQLLPFIPSKFLPVCGRRPVVTKGLCRITEGHGAKRVNGGWHHILRGGRASLIRKIECCNAGCIKNIIWPDID